MVKRDESKVETETVYLDLLVERPAPVGGAFENLG